MSVRLTLKQAEGITEESLEQMEESLEEEQRLKTSGSFDKLTNSGTDLSPVRSMTLELQLESDSSISCMAVERISK